MIPARNPSNAPKSGRPWMMASRYQDQWVELSPGEFRSSLTRAQNVANGSLAPELVEIPVPAPVQAQ